MTVLKEALARSAPFATDEERDDQRRLDQEDGEQARKRPGFGEAFASLIAPPEGEDED